MVMLLALVIGLYAFSSVKNGARKVSDLNIIFNGEDNLFITHETVSKLLIQNQGNIKNMPKETLDLNQLETALNSNPMIKSAQVFMSLNGLLTAKIEQKKPIARVSTSESFYIDDQGSYMPLSTNYTARVPLVVGAVEKKDFETIYKIGNKINTDMFLKKHVVLIKHNDDKSISLRLRQCNFEVYVGSLNHLDKKINNLKAFYQKAKKDNILNNYSKINLQFDNQVVCTKS